MIEPVAISRRPATHRRAWLRIFVGGLLLWVASVVVTLVTENSNLVPTVILLGSFLVPPSAWSSSGRCGAAPGPATRPDGGRAAGTNG